VKDARPVLGRQLVHRLHSDPKCLSVKHKRSVSSEGFSTLRIYGMVQMHNGADGMDPLRRCSAPRLDRGRQGAD
jgi:hypothetical protein